MIALYRATACCCEPWWRPRPTISRWRGSGAALIGRFALATRERIEREQRDGLVGPMPASEMAFSLSWMTERACYQRIVAGEDLDSPQFVEALVRTWAGAVYGRVP